MPCLKIYCDGGFGNRFNALISGLAAAEIMGYEPVIYWPVTNWCEAEYCELFSNNDYVHLTNLIDIKNNAQASLVLSGAPQNAEYLEAPFISVNQFPTESDFKEYCINDGRDILFHLPLIPPWITRERIKNVARNLQFQSDIVATANTFVKKEFLTGFYGIHLRRTDLILGYTDNELGEIFTDHPNNLFFVCSDTVESEKTAAQYSNVRIHDKQSYVERKVKDKGWSEITLYTGKAYYSNVKRNSQSVRDAVVDLLILSRSTIVGKSNSTFLNVAKLIKELSDDREAMLPEIDTIPIDETFRKGAAGILDIMLAISAAQQLWQAQKFDQAVFLLRLWLKKHDSPHKHVVLFNLSVYLENMGSLLEAEIYVRHVLYLQPMFLQGHLQLALVLEKTGRRDEATAQFLHAISLPLGNDPQSQSLRNTIINNIARLARGFTSL